MPSGDRSFSESRDSSIDVSGSIQGVKSLEELKVVLQKAGLVPPPSSYYRFGLFCAQSEKQLLRDILEKLPETLFRERISSLLSRDDPPGSRLYQIAHVGTLVALVEHNYPYLDVIPKAYELIAKMAKEAVSGAQSVLGKMSPGREERIPIYEKLSFWTNPTDTSPLRIDLDKTSKLPNYTELPSVRTRSR